MGGLGWDPPPSWAHTGQDEALEGLIQSSSGNAPGGLGGHGEVAGPSQALLSPSGFYTMGGGTVLGCSSMAAQAEHRTARKGDYF